MLEATAASSVSSTARGGGKKKKAASTVHASANVTAMVGMGFSESDATMALAMTGTHVSRILNL